MLFSNKRWTDEILRIYYWYIDIIVNENTGQLIGRSKTDARIYGSRKKWKVNI